MRPLAPVEYPTSRHLDTPSHKNSLAVSEKTSSRNCLENPNGLHLGVPEVGKTRGEAPSLPLCAAKNTCYRPVQLFSKTVSEPVFSETESSAKQSPRPTTKEVLPSRGPPPSSVYCSVILCF